MALDRLTKVDGGGISTTSDYRVGIVTASKFVGPFDGTGGNFSGIITASGANFTGNVTIGGTLTYEDVTNIDSVGLITARDGIFIPDTKKAQFGNAAGNVDLEIYSTGAESVIKNNTYAFFIQGGTQNNSIYIRPTDNENSILATSNGSVSLYYDNAKKFETVPNGVTVTGSSTFSQLKFKTSDGTNRGSIYADNSNNLYLLDGQDHQFIQCIKDGAVNIRHDNSIVLRTYSSGVEIVGALYATSVDLNDNQKILLGTGDDLEIYHNGSNSFIDESSGTGRLIIRSSGMDIKTENSAETMATFNKDGAVELYHDNVKRFETTSTGTRTTGVSVVGANAVGMGALAASTQFVVTQLSGNTNSVDLTILGGRSGRSSVVFGDHDDVNVGSVRYNHSDESIDFLNNNQSTSKLIITSGGNLQIPNDSGKLQLGASQDLTLFHTGTHNYINSSNGNIELRHTVGGANEAMLKAFPNGAIELYHNGIKQVETASSAVLLPDRSTNTGRLAFGDLGTRIEGGGGGGADDGLYFMTNSVMKWQMNPDGDLIPITAGAVDIGSASKEIGNVYIADDKRLYLGSDQNISLYHNNTTGINYLTGHPGNMFYQSATHYFTDAGQSQVYAQFIYNSYCELRYAGALKIRTSETGIDVTGEVSASQDYPNFRPTVDFNFAAEKKLDPRITFTRDGLASYVDENGDLKYSTNAPRFNHDPITKECKGLLMEGAKANLLLYSNQMSNRNTGANGRTILENNTTDVVAPDGTNTAIKMSCETNGFSYAFPYGNNGTDSNRVGRRLSYWVKKGDHDLINLTNGTRLAFTFSTKSFTNDGTYNTWREKVEEYPNDWYRLSYTIPEASSNATLMGKGSATAGDVVAYYWGFQLEEDGYETSYIPTDGASVTRAADSAVIDGEDFDEFFSFNGAEFNDYRGTLISFLESESESTPSAARFNKIQLEQNNDNKVQLSIVGGGTPYYDCHITYATAIQADFTGSQGSTFPTVIKHGVAFAKNNAAYSYNGNTVETDNSVNVGGLPTATHGKYTQLTIGGQPTKAHIKRVMYYSQRISNTQLRNLTS